MAIYADNAATTKMSKAAVETMLFHINETFGNPSSLYGTGQKAKEVLEDARDKVAEAIGADLSFRQQRPVRETAKSISSQLLLNTTQSFIRLKSLKKRALR